MRGPRSASKLSPPIHGEIAGAVDVFVGVADVFQGDDNVLAHKVAQKIAFHVVAVVTWFNIHIVGLDEFGIDLHIFGDRQDPPGDVIVA